MSQGVFYIPKAMIETYMTMTGGSSWSKILKEGSILPTQNCRDITEIKETTYTFPTGKSVKATIIRSKENGAMVYCSPYVPFGMIKVISSDGDTDDGGLVDFGFSGGRAKISKEMASRALPMPLIPGAAHGNMGKLPFNLPSMR